MIGIVGPADTLASINQVARELGLAEICVARAYADPAEAPGLCEELAVFCPVVLFSGRLPYVLASATKVLDARMEYIPHGGTDLYRTIVQLLLMPKYRNGLPRLSIDSIPASDVAEAFGDLQLDLPRHVFSLDLISNSMAFNPDELAEAHAQALRAGEVDLCLTCVDAVYKRLKAARRACLRVRHSHLVIREALGRAHLSLLLSQAESTQIAVCVVEPLGTADAPARQRTVGRRMVEMIARRLAESLDGTVLTHSQDGAVVITTRGAVERHLRQEISDRAQPLQTELSELVRVGIGFGGSTGLAEQNARHALIAAKQERRTLVAFENGTILPVGAPPERQSPRSRLAVGRLADELGLSSTSLQRILAVLREVGSGFTAREFASAYGVQPRSARRIISTLEERGLVEPVGTEQGPGAGRPQSVYQVKSERLASVASDGREAPPPPPRTASAS